MNVVEDENAYLGLEDLTKREDGADEVVREDEETRVVKVKNQFARPLSLSVTELGRNSVVETIGSDGPIEIGSTNTLGVGAEAFVTVKCETDETKEAEFSLRFSGGAGGTTVDKSRAFTFTCESVETESSDISVEFLSNGRVKIRSSDTSNVTATAYIRGPGGSGNGDIRSTDPVSVPVGKELKQKRFGWENNGDEIVGIEIEGVGLFTRQSADSDGIASDATSSSAEDVFGDDYVPEN
ncbi:hypothetical protein ABNG02_11865 [Halorubrum ejinorense]|uniref:Uncharacterized protein n=1 Tax=Halorubrum ejinorense TaxID=425309 RepID=A0ABV4IN88_9EURY